MQGTLAWGSDVTGEAGFSFLLLLLLGAVAYDLLVGQEIRWRKTFNSVVVVLFLGVLLTLPNCQSRESLPDIDPPPYPF